MKFFRKEEDPNARLPKNFMSGFLEVSQANAGSVSCLIDLCRDEIRAIAL